jgi:hypothetical protein
MIPRLQPTDAALIRRRALLALSLVLAACLPGADPHAAEPSRSETFKFIAEKVNQQGTVNVAGYVHDNATNKDSLVRESWEQSKLMIDPHKKCKMSYHKRIVVNGTTSEDADFWAVLGGVDKVEVLPIEQAWKRFDSRAGNTTLSYKADPAVSVVRVNVHDGSYLDFAFYEEDMANRVAKALGHAVDLCGGGKEVF